jgi:hypothetical protein
VIDGDVIGAFEKTVEARDLLVDGGIFEGGIEDVYRLVAAGHESAILPVVVAAPRWLPEREEGM